MAEVLLSIQNNIATLTLNRPRKGNALTPTMNALLLEFLGQIENNPEVRVVILTGSGKFFCTGMDLSIAASNGTTQEGAAEAFRNSLQVFEKLYRFPKPTIARVNGPCLGGGVGLVFTTDIRIAHKDMYFALTEVKRGILPAIISQYIVPEVGPQRAKEYMLTGRKVSAEEAKPYLSKVAASIEQLNELTADYASMLLGSAPGAMTNIKKLIDTIISSNEPERVARTQKAVENAYIKMMQSKEGAYGILAFLSKKKPDWSTFVKDNAKL